MYEKPKIQLLTKSNKNEIGFFSKSAVKNLSANYSTSYTAIAFPIYHVWDLPIIILKN